MATKLEYRVVYYWRSYRGMTWRRGAVQCYSAWEAQSYAGQYRRAAKQEPHKFKNVRVESREVITVKKTWRKHVPRSRPKPPPY